MVARVTQSQITQMTQTLVKDLRELASMSDITAGKMIELRSTISSISNLKINNINEAANALAKFHQQISGIYTDADIIKSLQDDFSNLAKTIVTFNTQTQVRGENLQAGRILRDNPGIVGFRGTAETRIDIQTRRRVAEQNARELKESASYANRALQQISGIWTLNEQVAKRIEEQERKTWFGYQISGGGFFKGTKEIPKEEPRGTNVSRLSDAPEKEQEDFFKKQQKLNTDTFRYLGLGDVAISNLTKQLSEYGLEVGKVTKPVTELSSGITTLTMSATNAQGVMQNFTAHIDRHGNVLNDTQKRYRSFGSAIMRDVVEVLKWTIAITAIYAPMRKMGEMLEQAKKVQLDLVDVQVALGNSTREMATVFEASSKIATETSSSIEGVIQGYSLAVAASASARNETERMVTTETLLKDSMILSKLANIEQKDALDMLVGALSQFGLKLTQGTSFLDSWVAVAKRSNVSVNQMAQSFAIVGSAAEEAGLNYHELNALVGTLAQNTTLSANELGNAIRGIIAAMQTDKAQAEFAKYGIATKTVSGDFRDLMDILRQLKIMQQGGILDEKAMGALMQAGGAGARRGAQLSAIVQNLPMVMDLITVSEQANGEAAQAMGLEMKTLDAATTRLNNSFVGLATALGGEGGILGFMTKATDGVTLLINEIKDLVSVMKWAAPVMASFMVARAALGTQQGAVLMSKTIPGFLQNLLTSTMFMGVSEKGTSMAGKEVTGMFAPIARALQNTGWGTKATTAQYKPTSPGGILLPESAVGYANIARGATYGELGRSIGDVLSRQFLGKLSIANLAGPAIMAATNIGREGGGPRAAAGGIVGLITAALTGSAIWATVGSIIATGFYDKFLTFEADIAASWMKWRTGNIPPEAGGIGGEGQEPPLVTLNKDITESLNYWEKLVINFGKARSDVMQGLGMNTAASQRVSKFFYGQPGEGAAALGISESLLAAYIKQKGGRYAGLDEETMTLIGEMINEFILEQAEQGIRIGTIEPTPFEADLQTMAKDVAQLAATASEEMMADAIEQMALGASDALSSYVNAAGMATELQSSAAYLLATQKRLQEEIIPGVAPPTFTPMGPQEAVSFMSKLDSQQSELLTARMTELNDQILQYNALIVTIPDLNLASDEDKKKVTDLENSIKNLSQEIPQLMQAFTTANIGKEAASKLKGIITIPEGLTADERDKVLAGAEKLWRDYLEASGLTDAEITAFLAQQEEQILKIGEGLSNIRIKTPQEYVNQQLQTMGLDQGFGGLQDLRSQGVTTSMWPQMMAAYNRAIATLTKQFGAMGWEPNLQYLGIILKDGFKTGHIDWSIMSMIMQDLLTETKKQGLQGIYNLPEGATFMIPVTGFELDQATRSEIAGGLGGAISSGFDELPEGEQQWKYSLLGKPGSPTVAPGPTEIANMLATKGNPLPVLVTNWAEEAQKTAIPGTYTPVTAAPLNNVPGWTESLQRGAPGLSTAVPTTQTPVPEADLGWFWNFIRGLGKSELANGGNPPTTTPNLPAPETDLSWLSKLGQFFNQLLGGTYDYSTTAPQTNLQTGQAPVTTALNLDMTSSIQLMVDGRTLATIIKPFLYQDLIRYMTSANSTVNRSVVG